MQRYVSFFLSLFAVVLLRFPLWTSEFCWRKGKECTELLEALCSSLMRRGC